MTEEAGQSLTMWHACTSSRAPFTYLALMNIADWFIDVQGCWRNDGWIFDHKLSSPTVIGAIGQPFDSQDTAKARLQ